MRTLDLGRAQPKQTLFLKDKHRHIAYGGARGGGRAGSGEGAADPG